MKRAVLLFILGLACGAPAVADEDLVVRSYDIAALTQASPEPEYVVLGLAVYPELATDPMPGGGEGVPYLTDDALIEWLRQEVSPELWEEEEDAFSDVVGTRLFIRAPQRTHEAVVRFLAQRWAEASERIPLEVEVLEIGGESRARLAADGSLDAVQGGRLTQAQADALRTIAAAAGKPAEAATLRLRPGLRDGVRHLRTRSYVGDYEVEIATDSVVGNPVIESAVGGWSFDVRAHRLRSGAVRLDMLLQLAGVLERVRTLPLETEPFGELQLPSMRVRRLAGACTLEPGEIRVWSMEQAGIATLLLLHSERREPGDAAGIRRWFPLRTLLGGAAGYLVARGPSAESGIQRPHLSILEPRRAPDSEHILDIVRAGLPDLTQVRPEPTLDVVEDHLVFRGDPAAAARIEGSLRAIEDALIQPKRLELRLVADGGGDRRVLAASAVDLLLGGHGCVQEGTEHAYLADWDVEVAQEARAGDPITGIAFDGLVANWKVDPVPGGRSALLHLELEWTEAPAPFEIRRPRNECTGPVELPKALRTRLRRVIPLELGKEKTIDLGTRGDAGRLALEVRVGAIR